MRPSKNAPHFLGTSKSLKKISFHVAFELLFVGLKEGAVVVTMLGLLVGGREGGSIGDLEGVLLSPLVGAVEAARFVLGIVLGPILGPILVPTLGPILGAGLGAGLGAVLDTILGVTLGIGLALEGEKEGVSVCLEPPLQNSYVSSVSNDEPDATSSPSTLIDQPPSPCLQHIPSPQESMMTNL